MNTQISSHTFNKSHNDTSSSFDVIVIGVGSMGAATCSFLAGNGVKVLGLEQFDIPHERGSHTGQSRLIRKAYFEHPDYVPLLQRAYQNWQLLEQYSDEQLYYETGLLYHAPTDHWLLKGLHASANAYQINLQNVESKALKTKYNAFHIPAGYTSLLEPEAGFIAVEKAIGAYTNKALQDGAIIKTNTVVQSWRRVASGIEVTTATKKYFAKKLVICAGPWAASILPQTAGLLQVTRQQMAWVTLKDNALFELYKMPCWVIATHDAPGIYYGFPVLPVEKFGEPYGFKLAHHYPGKLTDPDRVNPEPTEDDKAALVAIMEKFFPGNFKAIHTMKSCLYTNSPDEHFIIDFLPGYDQQVMVATGFSGHGFKFASVVGEILCDMAITGKTNLPIDFLSAGRFG